MSEYAKFNGDEVKIGTCQNLYFLRWDQRHLVDQAPHSLDANDPELKTVLRWRFPWPDEDHKTPGDFDGAWRKVRVSGFEHPEGVEHCSIQFTNPHGYNLCIPCPEGPGWTGTGLSSDHTSGQRVFRNGFNGSAFLVAQKWVGHRLVPLMQCACGGMYRLEEPADGERLAAAFRAEGQSPYNAGSRQWYDTIADRILAGIRVPALTGGR